MDEARNAQNSPGLADLPIEFDPPFLAYARALRIGWKTCVLSALTGLAVGWSAIEALPPTYRARASVEIVGLNDNFLGIDEITPTAPDSRFPLRTDMATHVRILRSDGLRRAAADRILQLEAGPPEPNWVEAVLAASAAAQITATDDSRIIDITCGIGNPDAAAGIVNALAHELVLHVQQQRQDQAFETRQWMDRQLDALADQSERSEARLKDYVVQAGLPLDGPTSADASQRDLQALTQELFEARSERMRLQARSELVRTSGATALPVEETPSLHDQQAALASLLVRRAELGAIYLPEHYKVQQLDAQIDEVRSELAKERDWILRRFEADYEAASRREVLLEEELSQQQERVRRGQEQALSYREVHRDAEANRELYGVFLKHAKQAGLAAGVPVETVKILDFAAVPTEPIGPPPVLGAAAGMLLGVFAGSLFLIAKDRLDRTFKRPGDVRRMLGLRELGAVPDAEFERDCDHMTPAGFAAKEHPRAEKTCLDDRPSWLAECVRGVRTSLLVGVDGPRVLTVTSPTPGDGKTTVAANLAASLAESGRRTLIVDADFRRPRLHEVFGVSNSQGFVDLLTNSYADPADFLFEISEGLWFLPAGVAAFGGPGLLHETAAHELLSKLQRDFEMIVLDAPPALAVSDARTLACIADGAILVVRSGVTNPIEAIEAKAVLEADGAHLIGVVLNSWNPRIYGPQRYEKYRSMYQRSAVA